jgi:hypothetical protein
MSQHALLEGLMTRTAVFRAALLAATALAGATPTHPAVAQSDVQIQDIEKQIKALQAELARVKSDAAARERALKAAQAQAKAAQDQAAAAVAQSQAATAQSQAVQAKMAALPVAAPAPVEKLPQGTFRVGGVTVTLGGFAAAEGVWRSRNEVASIGSSYSSGIPLPNSPLYYENEFRGTAQQSRFSMLAQGQVSPTINLASYLETDFLSAGSTSNSVESNSYTLRLRHFYGTIDDSDLGLHFLAGQAWSLLTANRIGIIPRQENIPLTIDAQYVVGFNWARQWQLRLVKDMLDHRLWFGVSVENPQTTYGGPTTGTIGGTVNALNPGGSLFNPLASYSNNIAPDVIAKIAADPGWGHYELFGLLRFFQDRVSTVGSGTNNVNTGEGIGGSLLVPLIPYKLDFQLQAMYGTGIGRYGSGQLPDVTVSPTGKPTPIPETMVMGGFVAHPIPSMDLYFYGGAEQESRKWWTEAGKQFGYGNPNYVNAGCMTELSPLTCSGNTSGVIMLTVGDWWRFFKGSYGTFQAGAQYTYLKRNIFSGAGPTPGSSVTPHSDENMFLISFRYLPFQ